MSLEARKKLIDELRLYVHEDNETCNLEWCPENCKVTHELDLDTAIAWDVASLLRIPVHPPISVENEDNILTLKIAVEPHCKKYSRLYKLIIRANKMGRPDKAIDY